MHSIQRLAMAVFIGRHLRTHHNPTLYQLSQCMHMISNSQHHTTHHCNADDVSIRFCSTRLEVEYIAVDLSAGVAKVRRACMPALSCCCSVSLNW